jgi:hypothetical protein
MSQIGGRPLMGLINRLREGVYSLEKTVATLRQLKSEALITNLSGRVILRMRSCVCWLRVTGIDRCAFVAAPGEGRLRWSAEHGADEDVRNVERVVDGRENTGHGLPCVSRFRKAARLHLLAGSG